MTRAAALAACQALGNGAAAPFATLASFRTAAQLSAVASHCGGTVPTTGTNGQLLNWWIGIHDENSEGAYQFVSGASTSYYTSSSGLWDSGQPDNFNNAEDLVHMTDTGKVGETPVLARPMI